MAYANVFEQYNDEVNGSYPSETSQYPSIWGNNYDWFVPQTFAIYFSSNNRFVIYMTKCEKGCFKMIPHVTGRTTPYYMTVLDDPQKYSTAYKIPISPTNTISMWFANAWLARINNDFELNYVVPVMHASNMNYFKSLVQDSYEGYKVYKHSSTILHDSYIEKYANMTVEQRMLITNDAKNMYFEYNHAYEPEIEHIKVPEYVKTILIEKAIEKADCCPITMDTYDHSTAAVTSCFHIFDKEAITTWLSDKKNKSKCPVCKQSCCL